MLRAVIWLLVLANAVYFAWANGHLAGLGWAPQVQTEPERMQTQVRPDMLRLLNKPAVNNPPASGSTPNGASTAPADATPTAQTLPTPLATADGETAPTAETTAANSPSGLACWQATGFTPEQAITLRKALGQLGWSFDRWQLVEVRLGGRWIVYMGPFSDDSMQKKKTELRDMKVDFREVNAPAPGLALGTFSSEEAAQLGLQQVSKKGVRTAKVEQERDDDATTITLRLPAVSEQERAVVAGMGAPLFRKSLRRCE